MHLPLETGLLGRAGPGTVGDRITIRSPSAIVHPVAPLLDERELPLVVQLRRDGAAEAWRDV